MDAKNKANMERELDRVQREIDQACQPGRMTADVALAFLERLAAHLDSSIEALKDENPELDC